MKPSAPTRRRSPSSTSRCTSGSRTTPPRPTRAGPASNWGLTRATTAPPGFTRLRTAGRTNSSEMNDRSSVTRSTVSPRSSGLRKRALVRSRTTTRGSWRRRRSNCPRPTSTAWTRRAPRCRRQSVNPPVEAPRSAATRPSGRMSKTSRAFSSFSPPRLAKGRPRPRTSSSAVRGIRVPGLSMRCPDMKTSPAISRAWAFSRLGARPRSTRAWSTRIRSVFKVSPHRSRHWIEQTRWCRAHQVSRGSSSCSPLASCLISTRSSSGVQRWGKST